ncbi:ankyrin repeat domain-containing protein [Corallococcus exiguus]|uniref:Ankyrin repeat domain-containing protein n=1 Tax=Corallococcus exiguus TaxID=83462 RepID=A0A7X4YJI9_9BACT|nr:ankyrin repeat domain-containing protein [Corallococcus exiguus]NBC45859.1 hypothetical protein [Corallococcus exiguus]TNV61321.1 ankyrin repeat domain-containing protein [Corallococcus exiguus]
MAAARVGRADLVRVLLEAGADPALPDNLGTPLRHRRRLRSRGGVRAPVLQGPPTRRAWRARGSRTRGSRSLSLPDKRAVLSVAGPFQWASVSPAPASEAAGTS